MSVFRAFDHPYFTHALLAGTGIAAAAGLVGYFLVLRAQVFTGDALGHVAFTGALAALALGYDLRLGLFVATVVFAVLIGALGRRGRSDDVAIGSVFAWILGLGAFFLTLYSTRGAAHGTAGVNVLFGSIFGLSAGQARTAALVAAAICAVVALLARPLLFASVDEAVAAARGVPVRTLGLVFLVLVGACAAEATQAVGSLLLLGLLAAPAGAAHRLTARPHHALALSAGLAVAEMWAGLGLSYAAPRLPPSFAILAVATAVYLATLLTVRPRRDHTVTSEEERDDVPTPSRL
ncbi:putative ABC-type Mn2+/Zn2+/Fe2+ transport system, permease component [Streptomyces himastatinicus ATCC 53653]|uniref:Putative ABC-type Mn2+/Zn2+/Fe2+ transport system, permease component n=1 Tax=Streptomyces himastatinicus ATCC 53653 TaxID=457427 RepID=D9WGW6_9ACTN|nr:metal ABC transporter permease [Streptomyces himastatinicus]EFL27446.1 putative ABC-type Mn2+/Zn2+/Fe2+ transport system, permease component [Streptomyces himastatinicus ATCC 53653]